MATELMSFAPRLIEGVLVGKRVVGEAAGIAHTVVWTDEGELYLFWVWKVRYSSFIPVIY